MDPITAAIIAALTSAITEVGKQGVQDAYNALKSVLARKYSARYGLLKAIDDLEKNPNSRKRKAVLQQEVEIANADQDQELLYYAYNLSQQVNHSRSYQIVSGSNNIAKQPGRDAYTA